MKRLVVAWRRWVRWIRRFFLRNRESGRRYAKAATPSSAARPPWHKRFSSRLRRVVTRLCTPSLPTFGRRKQPMYEKPLRRGKRKPDWVIKELLRLLALLPMESGRTIANVFNRLYGHSRQMTVGRTFVCDLRRKREYEIQVVRRDIKRRPPKQVPRDLIYGMDLTYKTDKDGTRHPIAAIVEHHSRWSPRLMALKDKSVITLLRFLLDAIEAAMAAGGQIPKIIRTDNEAVFASWRFTGALSFLGIQRQPIELGCPWQNGRIERFFGTLKEKLDQWDVTCREELNGALVQFRFWYNDVRPHQNLEGRTPAEVWRGIDAFRQRPTRQYLFEAWDGLLTGVYLKH